MHRMMNLCLALVLAAYLSGCQSVAGEEMVGAPDEVVNTLQGIDMVYASYNGQALSARGGQSCCIDIPAKWHPGMMATVEWTVDEHRDTNLGGSKKPHPDTPEWVIWGKIHESQYVTRRAVVPVPRYDKISSLTLVFLPCNQVVPLIDVTEWARVMNTEGFGLVDYDAVIQKRLGAKKSCPKS